MVEKYFTLKLWDEFIIPVLIVALIITATIIHGLISAIRWGRKEKWFKNNGYERYLVAPMNGYHDAIYEWRDKENKKIREDEAKRMPYRKFIKKCSAASIISLENGKSL